MLFLLYIFLDYKTRGPHVTSRRLHECAHPHAELLLLHFSSIKNYFKEHSRTQPDSKPFFLLCNAPPFSFVLSGSGSFSLLFAKMHHPQQLLRHLPAFQTHDVILHIVPGKEVHTAVPDDFLIDHSKMRAGIFGILNFKPCRPKAFQ